MKSVVILKKVDDLGRVTIPVDIRRQLKIELDEKFFYNLEMNSIF